MSPRTPQVGDTITTAEELDQALTEGPLDVIWFQCISTPERGDRTPWTCAANEDGEWWALRLLTDDDPSEWEDGVMFPLDQVPLPIVIVATSDTPPRPEREVKAEALREAADTLTPSGEEPLLVALLKINGGARAAFEYGVAALREMADRIERGDA